MFEHECRCLWRPEEGTLGPLKLELKAVVSYLTWGLGLELQSSGRAVCVLTD